MTMQPCEGYEGRNIVEGGTTCWRRKGATVEFHIHPASLVEPVRFSMPMIRPHVYKPPLGLCATCGLPETQGDHVDPGVWTPQ